jgi:hypothetical protein
LSPILVRPVREQLEHDRVIRQLQKDLSRRKIDVSINPGAEQNVGVGTGTRREFPDAVLFSADKGRKLVGIIEVETGESVNHLEAMAQWAHYARLKAPFHLYVPMASVDVARRLTLDHQIPVAEIHSYHQIGDMVRFASAYRSGTAPKLPDDPLPPEPVAKPKPTVAPAAEPAPAPKKGAAAAPPKPVPAKTAVVGSKAEKVVGSKAEKNGKSPSKAAKKAVVVGKSTSTAKKSPPLKRKAESNGPKKNGKAAPRPANRKAPAKKAGSKRK